MGGRGAYTDGFREWLGWRLGWRLEVPHHPDRQLWRYGLEEKPRGFRVLPRRWVVWSAPLLGSRPVATPESKDYEERLPETGEAIDLRRDEPHHAAKAGARAM